MRFLLLVTGLLLLSSPAAARSNRSVGSASCSASNCHGGSGFPKNQFTLWATQDKHSRAYRVLFNPESKRMELLLKLPQPAHESASCLDCHGMNVALGQRGPRFDPFDGIGCESCHGPASAWLEPHVRQGWSYRESVKLGMTDNRNLVTRGQNCLRCHGGIDHTLLASGHPDLVFELDTFAAVMPRHWKEKDRWVSARAWAIGQALTLIQAMEKTAERAEKLGRLDEVDRSCFSCHHNLTDVDWPLLVDTDGIALWNPSRYAVFRHFLQIAFPERVGGIQDEITLVAAEFALLDPDLRRARRAAEKVAEQTRALIPTIEAFNWEVGITQRVIASIAGDQETYRKGGFRTAEQAVMALDALTLALKAEASISPATLRAVKKLAQILDLKDPAHYNPTAFNRGMEELSKTLLVK